MSRTTGLRFVIAPPTEGHVIGLKVIDSNGKDFDGVTYHLTADEAARLAAVLLRAASEGGLK